MKKKQNHVFHLKLIMLFEELLENGFSQNKGLKVTLMKITCNRNKEKHFQIIIIKTK